MSKKNIQLYNLAEVSLILLAVVAPFLLMLVMSFIHGSFPDNKLFYFVSAFILPIVVAVVLAEIRQKRKELPSGEKVPLLYQFLEAVEGEPRYKWRHPSEVEMDPRFKAAFFRARMDNEVEKCLSILHEVISDTHKVSCTLEMLQEAQSFFVQNGRTESFNEIIDLFYSKSISSRVDEKTLSEIRQLMNS